MNMFTLMKKNVGVKASYVSFTKKIYLYKLVYKAKYLGNRDICNDSAKRLLLNSKSRE